MSVHYHSEDTAEYGLQDGCERCEEHATHPLQSLDDGHMRDLLERIRHNVRPRTTNEAIAMGKIRDVLTAAKRINRLGFLLSLVSQAEAIEARNADGRHPIG